MLSIGKDNIFIIIGQLSADHPDPGVHSSVLLCTYVMYVRGLIFFFQYTLNSGNKILYIWPNIQNNADVLKQS